jgi:phosphohistidine phosphatase SixA
MRLRRFALSLLLMWTAGAAAEADPWALLQQGGNVLLIRHAATEFGVGDPPEFRLGDCSTQRNLTDGGRADAKRLGEMLRARGVRVSEVRSSQWCRCLETARLAFGRAQPWPALNSVLKDASREAEQNRAVTELAASVKPPANLVLSTHSHNIRSLLGINPAQLEIVVARHDGKGLKVVGRIPPP